MADTATTLDNKYKFRYDAKDQGGFTHGFLIDWDVINNGTGSTDTETVTLGTLPANGVVTKAVAYVSTAFAGTGALTLEVGTDGDPNNFITSTSVLSAGPKLSAAGGAPATLAGSFVTADDVLQAVFTNATSGSPSALTAGTVLILLRVEELADYDVKVPN